MGRVWRLTWKTLALPWIFLYVCAFMYCHPVIGEYVCARGVGRGRWLVFRWLETILRDTYGTRRLASLRTEGATSE